jgi:hypothetical protein
MNWSTKAQSLPHRRFSLKPENKFRTWYIVKAKEYINLHYPGLKFRCAKHADMVTSGVPDMDISIGGYTIWFEFKLFTSLKKERKLDVTSLQAAYLNDLTQHGVPAKLLVGLALGPRKGYDVAIYGAASTALRSDFRPYTQAIEYMVDMAKAGACNAHHILSQLGPSRPSLVGHLPCLVPRQGADDVQEDGG